jgi:hypothetical protein
MDRVEAGEVSDLGEARASRRRRDRAVVVRADASAHLTGTTPRRALLERARSVVSLSSSAAVLQFGERRSRYRVRSSVVIGRH